MSDYIFLFDMDSTITKVEVLPTIANEIGRLQEMRELTEATMRGELPFKLFRESKDTWRYIGKKSK